MLYQVLILIPDDFDLHEDMNKKNNLLSFHYLTGVVPSEFIRFVLITETNQKSARVKIMLTKAMDHEPVQLSTDAN